jgi:thiamine-monophosphate kinase
MRFTAQARSGQVTLPKMTRSRDEFSIISRYFSAIGDASPNTLLSVGDDAAVVAVPEHMQLVVSTDTLISGVHFPEETTAADIAYKALAVNLSDLAAMAADPAWFLLSLTMPHSDDDWLGSFAESLNQTARQYGLQLIGGDTCRGSLSIGIQIAGLVPAGNYLTRSGANPGDLILVSGELGNAALGLASVQNKVELPEALDTTCRQALNRPKPRLQLRTFLRRFASAAIDISDGLQGDLAHILKSSNCGAIVDQQQLPVNSWIQQQNAFEYALNAGDDYEICCCLPVANEAEVSRWNQSNPDCRLSVIGQITDSGYLLHNGESSVDLTAVAAGYQHFD